MPRAPTEDERYFSPTRTGEVRKSGIVPLRGQAFGFTPLAEKNELEKELVRLGIQDFKFYPTPTNDPRLKQQLNKMYGEISEEVLIPYLRSKAYRFRATGTPRTRAEKRARLQDTLRRHMQELQPLDYLEKWASNKAEQGSNNPETTKEMEELIEEINRARFNRLNGDDVKSARNLYNSSDVKSTDPRKFDELPHKRRIEIVKAFRDKR